MLTTILSTLGGYGIGRPRYNFKFRGTIFIVLLFALIWPYLISLLRD